MAAELTCPAWTPCCPKNCCNAAEGRALSHRELNHRVLLSTHGQDRLLGILHLPSARDPELELQLRVVERSVLEISLARVLPVYQPVDVSQKGVLVHDHARQIAVE